jgi:flagellar protein FlaG
MGVQHDIAGAEKFAPAFSPIRYKKTEQHPREEVNPMRVDAANIAGNTLQKMSQAPEQLDIQRKQQQENPEPQAEQNTNKVQPEELLSQIKSLTEDGLYSVRFENDQEAKQLVVKVVDRETDEVIRQIPPEELMNLAQRLDDLRGNIVDTEG